MRYHAGQIIQARIEKPFDFHGLIAKKKKTEVDAIAK
jgi:hypothetical protein